MPQRSVVSRELAEFLSVLAHPGRLQIIEELGKGEAEVSVLQQRVGLSQPRTSQLLSMLKAHRLVAERKVGRRVMYRLTQPEVAAWLVAGLSFLLGPSSSSEEMFSAIEAVRAYWADPS